MKCAFAVLLAPVLAGCLSAHVPTVSDWNVTAEVAARRPDAAAFGVASLSQVSVCAPYDIRPMQVSRSDGTLAADAYNRFAAVPSRLLREPARTVLEAAGRFRAVVEPTSAATVSHVIELTVTDLRLDCAQAENGPERREAVAEVFALVLDKDRGIVASARAAAREDARSGNYGAAFSKAFARALGDAAAKL